MGAEGALCSLAHHSAWQVAFEGRQRIHRTFVRFYKHARAAWESQSQREWHLRGVHPSSVYNPEGLGLGVAFSERWLLCVFSRMGILSNEEQKLTLIFQVLQSKAVLGMGPIMKDEDEDEG